MFGSESYVHVFLKNFNLQFCFYISVGAQSLRIFQPKSMTECVLELLFLL